MELDVAESGDRPAIEYEIAITPEMIEAGISVYFAWDPRVEEPEGLVIEILEVCLNLKSKPL